MTRVPRLFARTRGLLGAASRRGRMLLPAVAAVTAGLLMVRAAAPAPALAVDLFPVDDWIGDGLKGVGKVVLGPIKFGAEQIAHLIGAVVAALADLLVPKSFVDAGVNGIRWLVQLPALGYEPGSLEAVPSLGMPHLRELRDTLTWIGLTLLPLQLVVAGGRSVLAPAADRDSPAEVLQRTIFAALALIAFDWGWGALTHLSNLITDALLRMPWVADGVERMLESLLIGGAAGTAVAAEFLIPVLLAAAGAVLLALMLLRIGLAVMASLVYATGGLALGLSVSGFGYRLLQVWLVAATGVFVLPVLWCIVFVCASALMLDTGSTGGRGGFGDFVGQLYNTGAALVTFVIAIKLARATLGHAATAIAGLTATTSGGLRGGLSAPRMAGSTAGGRGTPQSLSRFSGGLRGGMAGAAAGGARVAAFPLRHPVQAAAQTRQPVQATRDAAEHLRSSMRDGATAGAARAGAPRRDAREQRRGQGEGSEQREPTGPVTPPNSPPSANPASRPSRAAGARPPAPAGQREARHPAAQSSRRGAVTPADLPGTRHAAPHPSPPRPAAETELGPQTADAAVAQDWQASRTVVHRAPRPTRKPTERNEP